VFEYANVLPDKWKNRGAKLNVGDVAKAVQETPVKRSQERGGNPIHEKQANSSSEKGADAKATR
jgi:hypothetical protein